MVPGKSRSLLRASGKRHAMRSIAGRRQKIVGIGEHDEIGGPVRIGRNHVQEGLLLLIGDSLRQCVGAAGNRVERRQSGSFMFEPPCKRSELGWIPGDVVGPRVVTVHPKKGDPSPNSVAMSWLRSMSSSPFLAYV